MAYDITGAALAPLGELLTREEFPLSALFPPDTADAVFEGLYYAAADVRLEEEEEEGFSVFARLAWENEVVLGVPGVDLVQLVLTPGDDGWGSALVDTTVGPEPSLRLSEVRLALRVSPALLRPMLTPTEPDPAGGPVDIPLGEHILVLHEQGLDLESLVEATLPLCMVANTGVVLQAGQIHWVTPRLGSPMDDPHRPPEGFTGVYIEGASLTLPSLAEGPALRFDHCYIGTGGFTGKVSLADLALTWDGDAFGGDVHGGLLGLQGGLKSLELELRETQLVAGRIQGDVFLPFFQNRVGVDVQMGEGGALAVTAGQPFSVLDPANPNDTTAPLPPRPGYLLHLAAGEALRVDVDRVQYLRPAGGAATLEVSGSAALDLELGPLAIQAEVDIISVRFGDGGVRLALRGIRVNGGGALGAAELVVGETLADGTVVHRLALEVGEPLPLGGTGLVLERGRLLVELADDPDGVGGIGELFENARIELGNFRLTGGVLPGGAIAGDLKLVIADGALDSAASHLKRYEPDDQHLAEMGLRNFSIGRDHLAVTWSEPRVNYWLTQLLPGLADDDVPDEHELTLRVLFGDGGLKEIRFDWLIENGARRLKLPGVNVVTPGTVRLSLLLGAGGKPMTQAALALTFDRTSTPLFVTSDFAWERGADRELQNDTARAAAEPPLFELELSAQAERVTLVALQMDVAELGLPKFLQQLATPLDALDYAKKDQLALPTAWVPESLQGSKWNADFRVNAEKAPFELPFLKEEESRPSESTFPQVLKVERPDLSRIDVRFDEHTIDIPVGITLDLGSIDFATDVLVGFDWERFALTVKHGKGIEMVSDKPEFAPDQPHLGFLWKLRGAPVGGGKFSYFTLVTDKHNYQVVQTPGAAFEIAYTGISEEPITFSVTDFAVTSKGVSLNATVTDRPAKINGIDTRFRFNDTRVEIRENRIADFTLSGSGPLPPALVGDATADLSLQFGVRGGGLALIAGSARLKGNKLLDCRGTRFRFSVDALGVKFVNDGRYHLYFTLTGAAEFVPAAGDDADGALALLGKIRIDLVDAPLSGDMKVLAKHVRFLVELPKPKSFNFLGAFEMELRGIGFVPSADVFDGDAAMMLTGQLKFAQGAGDTPDSRTNVHTLYIGLPKPGTFLPRIHFKELPVHLNFGAAFRLNGVVEFIDTPQEKGFTGEGVLQIQGLPTIAASFAFLRVRRDEQSPWVRAWFIYIEARQVSFPIPVVQLYLREVGLGFGYRYTLLAIKEADRENDVRKLLASLKQISRTQGDLSKRDRWAVDLEDPGQDPRWTIVLRALISQTSASPSPLQWNEASERDLPCTFLFDAVIAFRSDLTFLMSVRAWLNANYYDYVSDYKGLRGKPLFSGFVLLSPRQKRLLANLSSNPDGQLGPHPPLPDFVQKALTGAQFSATILIEPGLLHYEMGWPNMLRWKTKVGPLDAEFRGGFIFRISKRELVTGASFLARASLKFEAKVDLGIVGARVAASASVAYGARYIGVVDFKDPVKNSALYAGVGIEVRIAVSLEFWIKLKLAFVKITKTFRFSLSIDFTAGLEVGFVGISTDGIGLRGHGTLSVKVMGRRLHLSVKIGLNEGAVTRAKARTEQYLKLGLEATDVEGIPGTEQTSLRALPAPRIPEPALHVPADTREPVMAMGAASAAQPVALGLGFAPEPAFAEASDSAALGGSGSGGSAGVGGAGGSASNGFGGSGSGGSSGFGGSRPGGSAGVGGSIDASAFRTAGEGGIYVPPTREEVLAMAVADAEGFAAPGYSVFVVRLPRAPGQTEQEAYFVLLPQGEQVTADGIVPEPGFLPPPPVGNVESDFHLTLPTGDDCRVEQWDPVARAWTERAAGRGFAWRAAWDAPVASGTELGLDADGELNGEEEDTALKLRDWLLHAFLTREETVDGSTRLVAAGDPDAMPSAGAVEDARVQNPSDAAFEAAVRGAVEQFRGSPFFKRDLTSEYERVLDEAFRDTTTVYTEDGQLPADPVAAARAQQNQQAQQLRGMVVHDLVSELCEFAEAAAQASAVQPGTVPAVPAEAVAFEMGLVFRVKGAALPAWLERAPADETRLPTLRQRSGPRDADAAGGAEMKVRTFNVRSTDFALNPPQFARVQQLTDATTIAVAWALTWERAPEGIHSPAAADPEEHLAHYHVRRRALSGTEREAEFTVKPADALNRSAGGVLQALRPRFQLVDHFSHETAEELAALPAEGRSYLYTVTPVDFAGNAGRPLTVVATRYPNEPPAVPTDAELVVTYHLGADELDPAHAMEPTRPVAVQPFGVRVEWSEPAVTPGAPIVAVEKHVLVLRRDGTLPIGSYGLDGSTQGPRAKRLPTSNARPLPTDVRIELQVDGPRQARYCEIDPGVLREAGVLPPESGAWRPESWRAFIQTVALNGVPSALAPVQLLLRAEPSVVVGGPGAQADREVEERRPAELEWLPRPIRFPLLPPEDQRATPGPAHVPMPRVGSLRFADDLAVENAVGYAGHPKGQRAIRFRWNQGPSDRPDYPLDLNAGFHLLELDADAHTTETFGDAEKLKGALRTLQEVQMVPAADLLLTPGDTLATGQWEAWYPSVLRRMQDPDARAQGSEIPLRPWLSWRESVLVWPRWDGLTPDASTAGGIRDGEVHPFLRRILRALDENPEQLMADGAPLVTYNLDVQVTPPIKPGNLADLFRATAPSADPYGWGILQRFGLTVAFSLRDERTGEVLAGPALVAALQTVLRALRDDPQLAEYAPHLHVELLFQPGHAVSLEAASASADGLLGLVQLSLRPSAAQPVGYARLGLRGASGATADLVFTVDAGTSASLIDQNDPASGQLELAAEAAAPAAVVRTVRLPASGETTLLLRGERIPRIGVLLKKEPDVDALVPFAEYVAYAATGGLHTLTVHKPLAPLTTGERKALETALGDAAAVRALLLVATPLEPFAATDERSTYFTVSPALAARFAADATVDGQQWRRFRAYAESLGSTDTTLPDDQRILVPVSGDGLTAILPDFLSWSQRFFDHGADAAFDSVTRRLTVLAGPWLATAYPRAGSPAYATPDDAGRLTYDHLVEDRWAHAYRYYVRPFGRYDLLWQSFRMSPALGAGIPRLEEAGPDPDRGGLDVVLDRTHPVAAPLVLGSRRLDPPADPTRPAAPGRSWEVLIAQHPEQQLAERNATLARQLGFQQVAFTLLRRFAYRDWVGRLSALVGRPIDIRPVEHVYPDVPAAYPDAPDHLALTASMTDDDARALDVPLRTGAFQQGAMAVRWDALPFFYEHRLLLAAQSTSTVSPLNEVVQRDFEYVAPTPSAVLAGAAQAWSPADPFGEGADSPLAVRARELRLPLRPLWDSLPADAQAQWAAERPDAADSAEPRRKPASLPDPEVVYQVVESFLGNVEVQAEIFFDPATERYASRPLGRRVAVDVAAVDGPPATAPQADFVLRAVLQPVAEVQLTRPYGMDRIPAAVRPKVAMEGRKLFFAGTMTAADLAALRDAPGDAEGRLFAAADRTELERIHLDGWSAEPVSQPAALPAALADRADVAATDEVTLVWAGPLSDADRALLGALPGDAEFRAAVERLAGAVKPESATARTTTVPGIGAVPAGLAGLTVETDEAGTAYTGLAWRGPLLDERIPQVERWARLGAVRDAVSALVAKADEAVVSVDLPEGATPPASIPESLRANLVVGVEALSWRGRVRTQAQLDALAALGGGDAFQAAVQQLVVALNAAEVRVEMAVPVRPSQATLPAALRGRLLISSATLRYHGVMSEADGALLRGAFAEEADHAAVARLYGATLNAGMRGRALRLRARRGGAEPSPMVPIDTGSL